MRRALALAAYLLFVALFVEASLQIFYRVTAGDWLWSRTGNAVPIYRADSAAGVFNRRNLDLVHRTNEFQAHYVTNSVGFRVPSSREYTEAKAPNTFRVMLVGASFAYGWGVDYESSFAGRLEEGLRRRHVAGDKPIELVNAGVPALPEVHQRAWFAETGRRYASDLVVQLAYGSLAIPEPPRQTATPDGFLVSGDSTARARMRDRVKRLATVFYGFVLMSRLGSADQIAGAGRTLPVAKAFSLDEPQVVHALEYFDEMRRLVEASGARYLVVYYPLSYVIHPQDAARWRHLGVSDPASQERYDSALCAALSMRGVLCADGTSALRRAASESEERLYFWVDIHWTPRGNAVASEHALAAIERFLDTPAVHASR